MAAFNQSIPAVVEPDVVACAPVHAENVAMEGDPDLPVPARQGRSLSTYTIKRNRNTVTCESG